MVKIPGYENGTSRKLTTIVESDCKFFNACYAEAISVRHPGKHSAATQLSAVNADADSDVSSTAFRN